jgi:hypothetical protein
MGFTDKIPYCGHLCMSSKYASSHLERGDMEQQNPLIPWSIVSIVETTTKRKDAHPETQAMRHCNTKPHKF